MGLPFAGWLKLEIQVVVVVDVVEVEVVDEVEVEVVGLLELLSSWRLVLDWITRRLPALSERST